ncbi:S41 family peptidase [Pelagicoccus sp. SDUM812002]|uniref:S41 family peptidase n=1 Tax=Pelagicoccus sp. SDUM812002 TaxID=3041266 RepID=UPI00280F072F|nr:S41 family peptidase [Pelagicoccus sp. SDUM812002]MDQ8185643.1 S41 family peptidase [Pelagicoccus sp. SDUM812002]
MIRYGRLGLAAVALLGTIACLPTSAHGELSTEQKERLVEAVGKKLSKRAYAFETDFSKWSEISADRSFEIAEAKTKEELANVLSEGLDTFGLSHLAIFAPSTVKSRRAGKRSGMGITIHPLDEDGGLISYVLADSPAERCGLRKGDILVSIDGEPLADIKQLAGELDQKRQITWTRGDEELSCEIEYASFSLSEPSTMTWVRQDVALVRVQSFLPKFYKATKINKFFRQARDARGIIIDLRNNRGGLSFYSRHLASKIDSPKETFALLANKKSEDRGRKRRTVHPLPFSRAYSGEVVILVDSLSASAADIVPAFVADNDRGIVIGQRTSGALQLAKSYPLPYGFRIYLPIAEMLTPNGNRLEGVGLAPHLELSLEETTHDKKILQAALNAIDRSYDGSE